MRPTWKSTLTLIVAGVVLIALSASGQPDTFWESGPSWLGDAGWVGSMIVILLLVVSGLYWVVLRMRHHDQPSPR